MGHARFVPHRGRSILFIDFSNCSADELLRRIDEAETIVGQQEKGSVLTLTDVTDTHYNTAVTERLKDYTAHNKPYVKAAAVVGVTGLKKIIVMFLVRINARSFELFDDVESAKDYLAQV